MTNYSNVITYGNLFISDAMVMEAMHRIRDLDQQCYDSIITWYRQVSYKNLKSQAHIYLNFCTIHNLSPFPADEGQMTRYNRYVADTVNAFDIVQNYTTGVRKLHDLVGFRVPDSEESN